MKVAICCPTRDRPHPAHVASVEAAVPLLDSLGIEHAYAAEVGCPYISGARATMLGKALKWGADAVVFLDDDVAFRPQDLATIIQAQGEVVGGTYRYKDERVAYMGKPMLGQKGHPLVRASDGAVHMLCLPAGFLRVSRECIERHMEAFPDLMITADGGRNIDLFNHGAYKGVWYGEDYAFCRRCNELDIDIWCPPDMDLDHHGRDEVFAGNYHRYLSTYKPEAK